MYKNDTIYYPQDEMNTFLLPVTRGCSYNKCFFCSMYKDCKYGEVQFNDIEMQLRNGYKYTEKIFLTGADPMIIGFDKMKRLLDMIHKYLPYCGCVSSYASIKNIAKYSVEELSILHLAGLRELYIGFETGSDDALKLMNKGHTVGQAIRQAKKLNQAKIPFNTIILYGIAGKGGSVDNALATAEMINQFKTNRIITMNLIVFDGTELQKMVNRGEFISIDRKERLIEIRTLLENLDPKEATIFDTTHPTNIFSIKCTLPEDREKYIRKVSRSINILK
jgi:radical SAM superfamily enzyme YgiQ (UPF0313 family)